MLKVVLLVFVLGAAAGAGVATFASKKKTPDTTTGLTPRDFALSEEAVATQAGPA